MKKLTKYIILSTAGILIFASCSNKEQPALVYFPDMYYPVAYDPYQEAVVPYGEQTSTIPLFENQNGRTALAPVPGTIAQNEDKVLPLDVPEEYNAGYTASLAIANSPLNPANKKADLARGKDLYNKTCAACHGTVGDGQGTIVQSGAYSGVPNYKDRQITIGSVYYVIEHGRNSMGSYAGQLLPGDRWRVALHVMSEFKKTDASAVAIATTAPAESTEESTTQQQ